MYERYLELRMNLIGTAKQIRIGDVPMYVLMRTRTETLPSASTVFAFTTNNGARCQHCKEATCGTRHFIFQCSAFNAIRLEVFGSRNVTGDQQPYFLNQKPISVLQFIREADVFDGRTAERFDEDFGDNFQPATLSQAEIEELVEEFLLQTEEIDGREYDEVLADQPGDDSENEQ